MLVCCSVQNQLKVAAIRRAQNAWVLDALDADALCHENWISMLSEIFPNQWFTDASIDRYFSVNSYHVSMSILFFSSALCYCTAELLSSRRCPSSVRKTRVSQNSSSTLMLNLVERYLFTISPDGEQMGEKLSESAQQICSQKFMHTPRKGLYQSCITNHEISNFRFLAFFFFWTFNMVVSGEL